MIFKNSFGPASKWSVSTIKMFSLISVVETGTMANEDIRKQL